MKQLKLLITGGAGFIGSHAVDRALADGHEVVVLDNLSTGRLENLEHHKGNAKLHFVKADISELESIKSSFENVDGVLHLAALADIVPSVENPSAYHKSNVDGTVAVLEASRAAGVKRFVYAASSSCYGIPDKFPTSEGSEARPMYPYALTKYLGEQCVMHWCQLYKMPAVSLRFFNVYGPRSRTSGTYGAVFGVFLAQKLHGKPYTVVGDGSQTRDFTYVTDVVDAVFSALYSDVAGEIMNVGSGNTYSVNTLVKLLGGEITYVPKRPGEPDCTFADTAKIKKLLNWNAKVSFEEGVKRMIECIDYWSSAPVWTTESVAKATEPWHKYLS